MCSMMENQQHTCTHTVPCLRDKFAFIWKCMDEEVGWPTDRHTSRQKRDTIIFEWVIEQNDKKGAKLASTSWISGFSFCNKSKFWARELKKTETKQEFQ